MPRTLHTTPRLLRRFMGGCEIRPIDGFFGYFVSSNGSIYSAKKRVGGFKNVASFKITNELHELKPSLKKNGYLSIGIWNNDRTKKIHLKIHRIGAEAFISNTENYPCVCHCDNNKLNNNVENLRWDTNKGNTADMIKSGTLCRGQDVGNSKLRNNDVALIKKQLSNGVSCKILAERFSVTFQNIRSIKNGITWRHITI